MTVRHSLEGLRVMLIEDDSLLAMLMESYLKELGCEVVGTAARLPDAMRKAADLTVDAAVLDVNLAGTLSYPVAELLRAKGVWVVFATGYDGSGLPPALHDVHVLAKPFNQDELTNALMPALRRR